MCDTTLGRFIAVVGASGVGKDSVILGIAEACPEIEVVRRTITRAPDLGGEDYNAVTQLEFNQRLARGEYCLHWQAHELTYGIPATVLSDIQDGRQCLANLSRAALEQAADVFSNMVVLNITASPETIAKRLVGRGRENTDEISLRLARGSYPVPANICTHDIDNNGPLQVAVECSLKVLGCLSTKRKAILAYDN